MGTRSVKWVPDTRQGSYAGFSWLMATILGAIEEIGREELWGGRHFISWCLGAECSSVTDILMALVSLIDPSLGVTWGKLELVKGACSPVSPSHTP